MLKRCLSSSLAKDSPSREHLLRLIEEHQAAVLVGERDVVLRLVGLDLRAPWSSSGWRPPRRRAWRSTHASSPYACAVVRVELDGRLEAAPSRRPSCRSPFRRAARARNPAEVVVGVRLLARRPSRRPLRPARRRVAIFCQSSFFSYASASFHQMRALSGSSFVACSYLEIASSMFAPLAWSPSLARFTASMLLRLHAAAARQQRRDEQDSRSWRAESTRSERAVYAASTARRARASGYADGRSGPRLASSSTNRTASRA